MSNPIQDMRTISKLSLVSRLITLSILGLRVINKTNNGNPLEKTSIKFVNIDPPSLTPTKLTPMKGKAWSGYDAIGGTSDRSVNTGIIKNAAAAIKKGRGGKVVSEGAVEKIKRILGITPKENPDDYEVIQPYRGGAKVRQRKVKAKEEPKPGLLDRLFPG